MGNRRVGAKPYTAWRAKPIPVIGIREAQGNQVPRKATRFINYVSLAGMVVLAAGLWQWKTSNWPHYFTYLLLALLAATMKVRLPRITGTISPYFLFILVGIAEFSFAETLLMGCAAVSVQCLWKPRRPPTLAQVLFNIGAQIISITVAYWIPRIILEVAHKDSLPVLLTLATCLFFLVNTLFVTLVISLSEGKLHKNVWKPCYLWGFPYYLAGAVIAATISVLSRLVGWQTSLLALPLMYLSYVYFRLSVERVAPEKT